jgi:hypothetical protein
LNCAGFIGGSSSAFGRCCMFSFISVEGWLLVAGQVTSEL